MTLLGRGTLRLLNVQRTLKVPVLLQPLNKVVQGELKKRDLAWAYRTMVAGLAEQRVAPDRVSGFRGELQLHHQLCIGSARQKP